MHPRTCGAIPRGMLMGLSLGIKYPRPLRSAAGKQRHVPRVITRAARGRIKRAGNGL